ncbi:MAG: sodium:proton antiporter [Deltaproteobacteria bacterium]|jgi:multicomponent Na+:H+ antiporter subunit G|nr:sodium:proton antiporter [Deltaproteobacteria bacterium]MBT6434663.1 sodium:proton antiporter [Deltaproteobacteria bacterium]
MSTLEIITGVFVLSGTLCCMIGALGLVRLPAFFERTHAGGLADTMGASLCIIGMIIYTGGMDLPTWIDADIKYRALIIIKLVSIAALLLVTSPIAGHALAKAAYEKGLGGPDAPEFEGVTIYTEAQEDEALRKEEEANR